MIPFGAVRWNDPAAYYRQDDNPTEHLLKVRLGGKGWLETCGPTAAVNCLAALGYELGWSAPGGYKPQPEQVLCDCLNDPHEFEALKGHWNGLDPTTVAGNEVARWYPWAVPRVFGGVGCEFVGSLDVGGAKARLAQGQALQVCLRDPGHYVSVVAYAPDEDAFVINDPWAGRWPNGSGWNQRLTVAEWAGNTKPVVVAYA